jgi:hypothetical protein
MKPVWAQVKNTAASSGIKFIEVDEDKTPTPGINGYPTIVMIDENGARSEYHGGPDFTKLYPWVIAKK